MGNGYLQAPNSCAEPAPNREMYRSTADANMHPSYYFKDHIDPQSIYPEAHINEGGWISLHQSNPCAEESRPHVSVAGRLADSYIVESGISIPLGHANVCDGHHVLSPCIHLKDQCYARSGVDYGNQVFQDQGVAVGSQIHLPAAEEGGFCYVNPPCTDGADNLCQVPHVHIPSHSVWRNVHRLLQGGPCYETSVAPDLVTD